MLVPGKWIFFFGNEQLNGASFVFQKQHFKWKILGEEDISVGKDGAYNFLLKSGPSSSWNENNDTCVVNARAANLNFI